MTEKNIRLDFASKTKLANQILNHRVHFRPNFIVKLEVNLRAIRGNDILEQKINKCICDHIILKNPSVLIRVVTYY
jgi:hypothetical protein